jgi:hypothetical protein
VRPAGTSATEEQVKAAYLVSKTIRADLTARGFSEPIFAESGNGYHLVYRLDDIPNNDTTTTIIKSFLIQLAEIYDTPIVKVDISVHNASRLIKLYGTVACKGDHTDLAPHRLSKIIYAPNIPISVSLEQLQALVPSVEKPPTCGSRRESKRVFRLDIFLARLGIGYKTGPYNGGTRYLLEHCPFNSDHGPGEAAIFDNDGKFGFRCQHNSCSDRHWSDVRELVDGPRNKQWVGQHHQPQVSAGQHEVGHIDEAAIVLEEVERLNQNHFVSCEGGRTYVFKETFDNQMGRNVLVRFQFIDFVNYYLNQPIISHHDKNGKPVSRSIGKVWLEHPGRRQYEEIVFVPGDESSPGKYNLWKGFTVEPVNGSWALMQDHIYRIICCDNPILFAYVLGWLATAVQMPGSQAETALVLRGLMGTGKGIIGNYMCKLFGENGTHIVNGKHLTGNFNSHLGNTVFLFVDEAFWAGDKVGLSVLKGLITEPTLTIEGKGRDVVFRRNMLHILLASNSEWVVPAGLEERRFCVLDVSDSKLQDKKYFADLCNQMDNGGLQAMLYDLLHYNLTDYEIRDVPVTRGLFEQKLQSLDPFSQWWFHRLQEGELISGKEWGLVLTNQLYLSYVESMSNRAISHRSGETMFGIALKRILPKGSILRQRRPNVDGAKREWFYLFPNLEVCRKHFELRIKYDIDWECPSSV